MVESICKEIELRTSYLENKNLDSIYLGGGTPSLLTESDLSLIFKTISNHYSWTAETEITLEANPDDLDEAKINLLTNSPVNRMSIGIQSFSDKDLKYMNRAHNSEEAFKCLNQVKEAGFKNLSVDLIYGTPTMSDDEWRSNIHKLMEYRPSHISAYCLTVEEGTALYHFVKSGKSKPVDDVRAAVQFEILLEMLAKNGYEQYEISNFCRDGNYAIHNTNYWLGKEYLGLGPGAHSYDGKQERSWNVAHNPKYISAIEKGRVPQEVESLSNKDRYNEYLMTRLRTKWGIDISKLEEKFPEYYTQFSKEAKKFIISKDMVRIQNIFSLTNKGKFLSDSIISELFTS